jgi:hypothetical protein
MTSGTVLLTLALDCFPGNGIPVFTSDVKKVKSESDECFSANCKRAD